MRACVRASLCACVRECVRARVRMCVCVLCACVLWACARAFVCVCVCVCRRVRRPGHEVFLTFHEDFVPRSPFSLFNIIFILCI